MPIEREKVYQLIKDLSNIDKRENALSELSSKREEIPDLANLLWHSFGSMTALVTEICSVYYKYDSPLLTPQHGNRVCNALALLQVIASHHQTVDFFLESKMPLFLYPFLQINNNKDKPFEFLKLTTLGVFGALVKKTNKNVIPFLLNYDLMPLCLAIMESNCNELSKIVATFIVQKILENEQGLNYCCETYNRFIQIYTCLNNMLNQLISEPSIRLFRHILNCYHKLSLNRLGSAALKTCLPEPLKNNTFAAYIKEDKTSANILNELIKNINKSDIISLINPQMNFNCSNI